MLKKVENVKSILEMDDSKASLLDSMKKSPLHAAAFNGTPEIAGMFYYNCILGIIRLDYIVMVLNLPGTGTWGACGGICRPQTGFWGGA